MPSDWKTIHMYIRMSPMISLTEMCGNTKPEQTSRVCGGIAIVSPHNSYIMMHLASDYNSCGRKTTSCSGLSSLKKSWVLRCRCTYTPPRWKHQPSLRALRYTARISASRAERHCYYMRTSIPRDDGMRKPAFFLPGLVRFAQTLASGNKARCPL